jgi:hypothetical protein
LEEIAHGIYEDGARSRPIEGLGYFLGDKAEVEALLVGVTLHASKAFGKGFSVAMLASGTDLCTAA